jgi:hypothetical protein
MELGRGTANGGEIEKRRWAGNLSGERRKRCE